MATEHAYQDDDERGVEAYAPTSLAPVTTAQQQQFTSDQIALIKAQIAPDASDGELKLFIEVCRQTGLNPFMRQIYAISRSVKVGKGEGEHWMKKMTIQTGIDGYRLLAARSGHLAGIDDAVYDRDEPNVTPGRATVTVWRWSGGRRCAFTATARWDEYCQKDSTTHQPTSMWTRLPYLMLAKCGEALALRKAFPAELSGIYTDEEMMQADNMPPTPYIEQAATQAATQDRGKAITREAPAAVDRSLRDRARAIGIPDTMYASQAKRVIGHGAPYSADDQARWEAWIAEREQGLAEAAGATGDDDDAEPEMTFTEATPATPDDLSALPVGQRGN